MTDLHTDTPATEVYIRITGDDDATRIASVLEALGYRVIRELDQGDAPQRLAWAVDRLARRHRLTTRERDILALVLDGYDNEHVGRALDISRATVKWHMHNLFAKTRTDKRESLLRLALQLGSAAGSPAPQPARIDGQATAQRAALQPAPAPTRSPAPSPSPAPRTSASPRTAGSSSWPAWTGPEVTARLELGPPARSAESIPSKIGR